MTTTLERARKIVADHLCKPIEEIKDDATFVDDLGMDSLDQLEIIMKAEEEFGIEISDADIEVSGATNVVGLASWLDKLIAANMPAAS